MTNYIFVTEGELDALESLARRARTRTVRMTGNLTQRELDVVELVADGWSNAEIAGRLHVAEQTVKFHVGNSLRKVGARNRAHLAALAVQRGWLRPHWSSS